MAQQEVKQATRENEGDIVVNNAAQPMDIGDKKEGD